MILQDPNKDDELYNGCLTLFDEDLAPSKRADRTTIPLRDFLETTGINGRSIYVVNSLLCWQSVTRNEDKTWEDCWLPCLHQGWLGAVISLCSPKLIITFGGFALRSVWHSLKYQGWTSHPVMKIEVNKARNINGKHVYPLSHTSPRAQRWRPLPVQTKDWVKCKEYKSKLNL
jgi:uracil-DNA glycosylase